MKISVSDTIDKLGGPLAASKLCGMSNTAVRHWYKTNRVPHWQEARFAELAKHLPKPSRPRKAKAST